MASERTLFVSCSVRDRTWLCGRWKFFQRVGELARYLDHQVDEFPLIFFQKPLRLRLLLSDNFDPLGGGGGRKRAKGLCVRSVRF